MADPSDQELLSLLHRTGLSPAGPGPIVAPTPTALVPIGPPRSTTKPSHLDRLGCRRCLQFGLSAMYQDWTSRCPFPKIYANTVMNEDHHIVLKHGQSK